ncbi:MAG TPA: PilT/PilU family type 4a pilus ATPase [Clostridiaceae bacterium]|nr:PilT/PilU family type 4a pilus ATPase [Clostridiaceae bacterium]
MYTYTDFLNLIKYAREANATNIHLVAGAVPAIRVEGRLLYTPFETVLPKDTEMFANEILNEEQKSILNKNFYISVPISPKNIGRLRVNIFKQRNSYSINIKLLDKVLKNPEELGIPQSVINLCNEKSGLILVCGNTDSGRSTTMASLIKKISSTRECHIITIEDPIEYLFKHDKAIVNQKEVGIDVNSFEEGIYSAITQDADVIMVSSAIDPATFSAVLTAAEDGHLVITSLHTDDSISTIEYIIGMYPAEKSNYIKIQLSHLLLAIVSQCLIPGVDNVGNKLAVEVMIANQAMQNLILENKIHQIPTLIRASKSIGMITMEDSINELYTSGLISKESALSYLSNRKYSLGRSN